MSAEGGVGTKVRAGKGAEVEEDGGEERLRAGAWEMGGGRGDGREEMGGER